MAAPLPGFQKPRAPGQGKMELSPEKTEYVKMLNEEKEKLEDSPNALRLVSEEIDRVQTGRDSNKLVELHHAKPMKLAVKVLIPVKQFPKFNFVGKLLGPKGNTLKRLQEDTGTKIAILGRGSMRDKAKEEELRKEGGKYSHLNEDLHALVEFFGLPAECHSRVAHALNELRAFLIPEENDEIRAQQMEEMMYMNGEPGLNGAGRGRGRGRGAPPPPHGRGGPPPPPAGGPGALLATPRGGPPRGGMGRSAPPPSMGRSAPPPPMGRAAPPMGRPAVGSRAPPPSQGRSSQGRPGPGRPAPPARDSYANQDSYYQAPPSSSYTEDYNYEEQDYSDYQSPQQSGYSAPASQETEYYDYGHGGSGGDDQYGSQGSQPHTGEYGDSWNQSSANYGKAPAARARSSIPERSHPYAAATASRAARY